MGCTSSSIAKGKGVQTNGSPRPASGKRGAPTSRGGGGDSDDEKSSQSSDSDRLYALKDTLRKRALPLIEARSSCENLDALQVGASYSDREHFAALRIQKQLKRKQAKIDAEKEQKWMIFSNLDAFDEAEMVKLASFMESAMKSISEAKDGTLRAAGESLEAPPSPTSSIEPSLPTPPPPSSSSLSSSRNSPNVFSSMLLADDGNEIQVERSISAEKIKLINMDQLAIAASYNKSVQFTTDFDLPAGQHITPAIAKTIIDVFKHGGRLSTKAVTKLLRLTYRKLQMLPNTTKIRIENEAHLTIVGDIHGQLPDLLHILSEVGQPSADNKYIFNGDFVDRGPCGVEVMCILMALYLAHPDCVTLNRGNHEDFAICCVYGFQKECCEKYDYEVFGMFSELFQHLPLFAIVNDAVFVLHGGLFHAQDILLRELDEINRTEFSLKDLPEGGEPLQHVPRENRAEFLKQLQRDALWSDPMITAGFALSSRGAGVNFGPDVASRFLELNNLKMVVRSHEVCRTGFELPFSGDDQQKVATIFSASNYSGGGNSAAYMTFSVTGPTTRDMNAVRVPGCDLQYRVYYFHIDHDDEELFSTQPNYTLSLHQLIIKKKEYLLEAFELSDPQERGFVSKQTWTDVMQRVLQLPIRWLSLISELVQKESLLEVDGQVMIDYNSFIQTHSASLEIIQPDSEGADASADAARKVSPGLIDSLYAHHKELFAVFSFFDLDGDGKISQEDFRAGCATLHRANSSDSKTSCIFQECDAILEIMDFQGEGFVDINGFYEMFRVSDTVKRRRSDSKRLIRHGSVRSMDMITRDSRTSSFRNVDSVDISGAVITSDPELAKLQTSTTSAELVSPTLDI